MDAQLRSGIWAENNLHLVGIQNGSHSSGTDREGLVYTVHCTGSTMQREIEREREREREGGESVRENT